MGKGPDEETTPVQQEKPLVITIISTDSGFGSSSITIFQL